MSWRLDLSRLVLGKSSLRGPLKGYYVDKVEMINGLMVANLVIAPTRWSLSNQALSCKLLEILRLQSVASLIAIVRGSEAAYLLAEDLCMVEYRNIRSPRIDATHVKGDYRVCNHHIRGSSCSRQLCVDPFIPGYSQAQTGEPVIQ